MAKAVEPVALLFGILDTVTETTSSNESGKKYFPDALGPFAIEPTVNITPSNLIFDESGGNFTVDLLSLQTPAALLKNYIPTLGDKLHGLELRKAEITLCKQELAELGIDPNVTHYARGAISHVDVVQALSPEELHKLATMHEPDVAFLIWGGYFYFDATGACVSIMAILPSGLGRLNFGSPRKLNSDVIAEIRASCQFQQVTLPDFRSVGAREFAWVSTEVTVAGEQLCPHGGFVYVFPEGIASSNSVARSLLEERKRIVRLFENIDDDRNGTLTLGELRSLLKALDSNAWTDKKVDLLFRSMDLNNDSLIQYSEFVEWIFSAAKKHGGAGSSSSRVDDALSSAASAPAPAPVEPAAPSQRVFDPVAEVRALARLLPAGRPRLCILGGRKCADPLSEKLIEAVARRCTEELGDDVVALTGGLPGVQQIFATSLGAKPKVIHLLPEGDASNFGVGQDLHAGSSMEERMAIYGHLGDVYLTFEGGPGVAKEAIMAHSRGAAVLPMMWTGGASGGMFNFPPGALEPPACCSAEEWALLQERGSRDEETLVSSTADAAVRILRCMLRARGCLPP
eukprot:TRINITY_DN2737_c0_g2_i1.p1 TRINITY_DN2737_c0_g2~~TRINITY_DN2737_c0_g2_i1.p1  ORF type:complete len:571 (-),score=95.92 TRINITY_DN2737_c0_g2_i1:143-1855(-)